MSKKPNTTKEQECTVPIKQLVDCFGVTRERIGQLVESGVVVRAAKNAYNLHESAKRYIASIKSRASSSELSPEELEKPRTLEAAKLQKVLVETKRQQLAYESERGALIDALRVRESGVRAGALLSATLQSKPSAWAPLLAGKNEDDIQEILQNEVSVMLEMLKEEFLKRASAE